MPAKYGYQRERLARHAAEKRWEGHFAHGAGLAQAPVSRTSAVEKGLMAAGGLALAGGLGAAGVLLTNKFRVGGLGKRAAQVAKEFPFKPSLPKGSAATSTAVVATAALGTVAYAAGAKSRPTLGLPYIEPTAPKRSIIEEHWGLSSEEIARTQAQDAHIVQINKAFQDQIALQRRVLNTRYEGTRNLIEGIAADLDQMRAGKSLPTMSKETLSYKKNMERAAKIAKEADTPLTQATHQKKANQYREQYEASFHQDVLADRLGRVQKDMSQEIERLSKVRELRLSRGQKTVAQLDKDTSRLEELIAQRPDDASLRTQWAANKQKSHAAVKELEAYSQASAQTLLDQGAYLTHVNAVLNQGASIELPRSRKESAFSGATQVKQTRKEFDQEAKRLGKAVTMKQDLEKSLQLLVTENVNTAKKLGALIQQHGQNQPATLAESLAMKDYMATLGGATPDIRKQVKAAVGYHGPVNQTGKLLAKRSVGELTGKLESAQELLKQHQEGFKSGTHSPAQLRAAEQLVGKVRSELAQAHATLAEHVVEDTRWFGTVAGSTPIGEQARHNATTAFLSDLSLHQAKLPPGMGTQAQALLKLSETTRGYRKVHNALHGRTSGAIRLEQRSAQEGQLKARLKALEAPVEFETTQTKKAREIEAKQLRIQIADLGRSTSVRVPTLQRVLMDIRAVETPHGKAAVTGMHGEARAQRISAASQKVATVSKQRQKDSSGSSPATLEAMQQHLVAESKQFKAPKQGKARSEVSITPRWARNQ